MKSTVLLFAIALSACSSGGGGGGSPTTAPANPTSPSDKQADAQASCPWSLNSSPTLANYKAAGVAVEVDCPAVVIYQYSQSDLDVSIQELEAALPTIKASPYKLQKVVISAKSFHDSNSHMVQIALGQNTWQKDFPHFIDVTLQLMNFEQVELHGQVRLNYAEIEKGDFRGQLHDLGTSTMFAPTQDFVDKDVTALRKFKDKILAHASFYNDIVLFTGDEISYFQLHSYTKTFYFSSSATDEQNNAFFTYLLDLEHINERYANKEVEVQIYRNIDDSYKANFAKTNHAFEVGNSLRSFLADKPFTKLLIQPKDPADASGLGNDYASILLTNGHLLMIRNIFDSLQNPIDQDVILACLQNQDFSKPFSMKCPAPNATSRAR